MSCDYNLKRMKKSIMKTIIKNFQFIQKLKLCNIRNRTIKYFYLYYSNRGKYLKYAEYFHKSEDLIKRYIEICEITGCR